MPIEPDSPPPQNRAMAGRRRTSGDPSAPHDLAVTGLTFADVQALDRIVDRLNATAQPGFTTSRNALIVATLKAFIDRETPKGGE